MHDFLLLHASDIVFHQITLALVKQYMHIDHNDHNALRLDYSMVIQIHLMLLPALHGLYNTIFVYWGSAWQNASSMIEVTR